MTGAALVLAFAGVGVGAASVASAADYDCWSGYGCLWHDKNYQTSKYGSL